MYQASKVRHSQKLSVIALIDVHQAFILYFFIQNVCEIAAQIPLLQTLFCPVCFVLLLTLLWHLQHRLPPRTRACVMVGATCMVHLHVC